MATAYTLTPRAVQDLKNIWKYVSEHNPEAARKVEAEIFASCEHLAQFPFSGSQRDYITSRNVRFWTIPKYRNYLIVYRPETDPLEIVTIAHGKRNLQKILL